MAAETEMDHHSQRVWLILYMVQVTLHHLLFILNLQDLLLVLEVVVQKMETAVRVALVS